MKPVNNKADFVKRYNAGEFGNRSPTWDSLSDFLKQNHDPTQLVHIRNRITSGETWYNVEADSVPEVWRSVCEDGKADPRNLYLSYMAPTHKTRIQGEVMITPNGLCMFYSRLAKTMRSALAEDGRQVCGIMATQLLELFLSPQDYEWLGHLLETYDGHVIEFSNYAIPFGVVPGSNTCFWEVRNY